MPNLNSPLFLLTTRVSDISLKTDCNASLIIRNATVYELIDQHYGMVQEGLVLGISIIFINKKTLFLFILMNSLNCKHI